MLIPLSGRSEPRLRRLVGIVKACPERNFESKGVGFEMSFIPLFPRKFLY